MDSKVYTEESAKLKENISNHEKKVIEGEKKVKELNEFLELHQEVEDIINEYYELSQKDDDPSYEEKLREYLKEELDYLSLISSLLDNLKKFYEINDIQDSKIISNDWENARIIIEGNYYQQQIKKYKALKNKYSDNNEYKALEEEFRKKYNEIVEKIVDSTNIINSKNNGKEIEDNNKVLLDEDEFDLLTTEEKIKTLETIMENIEKAKGKKQIVKVNGEKKLIYKKYASRYQKYNSMLNNLRDKKKEEDRELLETVRKISDNIPEPIDVYLENPNSSDIEGLEDLSENLPLNNNDDLYNKYDEILSKLYGLANKAEDPDNFDKSKFDYDILGDSLTFLESDYDEVIDLINEIKDIEEQLTNYSKESESEYELNSYKNLNYNVLQEELNKIQERIAILTQKDINGSITEAEKNEFDNLLDKADKILEEIDNQKLELSIEKEQNDIIMRIRFLSEYELNTEIKNELIELIKKYYDLESKKREISLEEIKEILEKQGFSEKEADDLAEVALNPEAFQDSNEIDDNKKAKILNALKKLVEPKIAVLDDKFSRLEDLKIWMDSLRERANNIASIIAEEELFKNDSNAMNENLEIQNNVELISNKIKALLTIKLEEYQLDFLEKDIDYLNNQIEEFENKYNLNLSNLNNSKKTKFNFKNIKESVSKTIGKIPKPNEMVLKIKSKRKSKDKKTLKGKTKKKRIIITSGLVISCFIALGSCFLIKKLKPKGTYNTKLEENINDAFKEYPIWNDNIKTDVLAKTLNVSINTKSPNAETETEDKSDDILEDENTVLNDKNNIVENNWNIGDTFTIKPGSPIYDDMYDAASNQNGLKPYFSNESIRTVTGIFYSYNGNTIFVDGNDVDFAAKRDALEANGAVLLGVLSENIESPNEYEGFYNNEYMIKEGKTR